MTQDVIEGGTYPTQWEADVILRSGDLARIRPINPGDADAITQFHARQSEESIYFRFFAPLPQISDADMHKFTHVDHHNRVALVVYRRGVLIGIGRFDRLGEGPAAEVAFNVADSAQGLGVGSILLEHLASIADELGIRRFVADVLPQNRKMQRVFSDAGYTARQRMEDGVMSVTMNIAATTRSHEVQLAREHRSEALSMEAVFVPRSVAVFCQDESEVEDAEHIAAQIRGCGFGGELQLLSPLEDDDEFTPAVDILVVGKPPHELAGLERLLLRTPVRVLLVLGSEPENDPAWIKELVRIVRTAGTRLIGPESGGIVVSVDGAVVGMGREVPDLPQLGVGVFSHSLASGEATLREIGRRGLYPRWFVSVGERLDVSANDTMQWSQDDDSIWGMIVCLDTMGNPRKFVRIARELARRKPCVAVVAGSHEVEGSPPELREQARIRHSLVHQTGLLHAPDVEHAVDLITVLAAFRNHAPSSLAVVAEGYGTLRAVQSAVSAYLPEVPTTAEHTAEMSSGPHGQVWERAAAAARKGAALLVALATSEAEHAQAWMQACEELLGPDTGPIVMCLPGGYIPELRSSTHEPTVPVLPSPVRACATLQATWQWMWRSAAEPAQVCLRDDVDHAAVQALIQQVLLDSPSGRELTPEEVHQVLDAYGIAVWPHTVVRSAEEAANAVPEGSDPMVMRVLGPEGNSLISGAVRGNVCTPEQARHAYESMVTLLEGHDHGEYVVQRQAPPGIPMVIGSLEDPACGPLVSCGIAGPASDVLGDVTYRIAPLTRTDVIDMVSDLRGAPLLRDTPAHGQVDEVALREVILRVALLADQHPQLHSMSLVPVNVRAGGCDVLGAKIVVQPGAQRRDPGVRVLPKTDMNYPQT